MLSTVIAATAVLSALVWIAVLLLVGLGWSDDRRRDDEALYDARRPGRAAASVPPDPPPPPIAAAPRPEKATEQIVVPNFDTAGHWAHSLTLRSDPVAEPEKLSSETPRANAGTPVEPSVMTTSDSVRTDSVQRLAR